MPTDPGASGASTIIPFAHPEALTEPEKLLAAYFSSSTIGLCVLDSDFRYLAINNTLAQIHGVPAPDHVGRRVREVLGDVADVVEDEFRRALSGEPVLNSEFSAFLPARAEVAHWLAHFIPIKNASGTVNRVCAVVVEITQQKRMQHSLHLLGRKLKNEMERLQMLLDVSSLLASNWDVQKIFPKVSASIRRVLRQEYAGFELHDASTGLLIRQAEDFPLGKGLASGVEILAANSPGGRSLQLRAPMIFSKPQLQSFEAEIVHKFLAEGLQSLCCVPLLRPTGPLGVLVLGSTRKDAFQAQDLTLLNQVAAQLAIALKNHRAAAEIGALKQRLAEEKSYLDGETRSADQFGEIIGESPALKHVLDQVGTVAASEATVLILGRTPLVPLQLRCSSRCWDRRQYTH